MGRIAWTIYGLAIVIFLFATGLHAEPGYLYGTIVTDDGDELSGRIRWDKNEGSWDDILDANKVRKDRHYRSRRRDKKVSIFGIEIFSEGGSWSSTSQAGIRFGYIDKILPRSGSRSSIVLKNGEKIKFDGGSDLSSSIREILIDDIDEGVIELDWGDIEEVQFLSEISGYQPSREFAGFRLYGTVETESGVEFEGFIHWDVDEVWSTDILDGDQRSKSRKIPFRRIEKIEKLSSRTSRVTLTNETTMKLSGSNDVDDDNRGIVVMVPDWGRVTVAWEEFESLILKPAPDEFVRAYDDFEEPWRLRGTVYTDYGDEYTGEITWDDDEQYSWEFLDGEYRDMEFDLEFAHIKSIKRRTSSSCEVTLFSGDKFRLRGSNDVNDENKGIYILTDDGDEVGIDWDEFEKVEFEKGE